MRSLSGIQPSGILHIGNYFGALKQFVDLQNKYEGLYFIADLHSLTSTTDPMKLNKNIKEIVLDYLALGLDPKKSTIFIQSDVPCVTELTWYLSNVTPISLMERGHAYKDKVSKGIKPNMGLFNYPILMAADILLYDTDIVPIGKDQKQHIEFTRDIAIKFNELYGETFKLPQDLILESVSIIPGTNGDKMSKSYGNVINMFESEKVIKKQVMSIVTDSKGLEESKAPDNNITKIYELFASSDEVQALRQKFISGGYGYGHAKNLLYDRIMDYFSKSRKLREQLQNNEDYVVEVLNSGAKTANQIASKKLEEVRKAIGLYR